MWYIESFRLYQKNIIKTSAICEFVVFKIKLWIFTFNVKVTHAHTHTDDDDGDGNDMLIRDKIFM